MQIAHRKRWIAGEGMKSYMNAKKAGLLALAFLVISAQYSCGTDKAQQTEEEVQEVAEAPAEEQEETQPEITPGEMQGPQLEAEEPENSEPQGDPDHHPEPPPEEEIQNGTGDGALSPPSDASSGSVFGGTQSSGAVTDEALSGLLSSLAFPTNNGSWSAYVCNISANTEGSVNEHRMQAASLIKLYIMGAAYENYDNLAAQYGQGNVDSNLRSMITVSDNDAANTLTGYLGGGDAAVGMNVVNEYCSVNGYSNTHMGRLLLHSNELDDNYTSPADCGHFLKKVYDGWKAGDPRAAAQFNLLAGQERRNKIPARMPAGVSVANKTGELADVENDAGIIYNTQNDLILVFMSEQLSEAGSAQSTIAALSRQIYDYYQQ